MVAQHLPLLHLPAELRNLIWKHAFETFVDLVVTVNRVKKRWDEPPQTAISGLLLACRQIYDEAIAICYSWTTFRSIDYVSWKYARYDALEGITEWLDGLPSRRID